MQGFRKVMLATQARLRRDGVQASKDGYAAVVVWFLAVGKQRSSVPSLAVVPYADSPPCGVSRPRLVATARRTKTCAATLGVTSDVLFMNPYAGAASGNVVVGDHP